MVLDSDLPQIDRRAELSDLTQVSLEERSTRHIEECWQSLHRIFSPVDFKITDSGTVFLFFQNAEQRKRLFKKINEQKTKDLLYNLSEALMASLRDSKVLSRAQRYESIPEQSRVKTDDAEQGWELIFKRPSRPLSIPDMSEHIAVFEKLYPGVSVSPALRQPLPVIEFIEQSAVPDGIWQFEPPATSSAE